MAEDLNDIFTSYGDKSLEELGSSLLSRQAEINKKRAKEAKKSKKIGQALAAIGVGQKLFKNAYNKRMKELDKHELFLLSNQENQTKQIQQFGRIMQYMPDKEWAEKNKNLDIDSKVKLYFEEYDGKGLAEKFTPMIDTLIKQSVGEGNFDSFKANSDTYDTAFQSALHETVKDYLSVNEKTGQAKYLGFEDEMRELFSMQGTDFDAFKANSDTYDTTFESALHETIKDYLSIDEKTGQAKYLNFENEMRELFSMQETDFDAVDVFERARNLKTYDLTSAEKSLINQRRQAYRNRGVMNVLKDGLAQVGLRQKDKGGINVFKSIDQTQLAGGNLNDVLNSLELGGLIIGSVDETMGRYRKSYESLSDKVRGDEKLFARANENLDSFDTRIRRKNIYDSDNKYKMTVSRGAWRRHVDDIMYDESNTAQRDEWVRDIASLSLAFKEDTDFAEKVYVDSLEQADINYTNKDIEEFRSKIKRSEQYRFDIATAITAKYGFKKGGASIQNWASFGNAPEYYDFDTDEKVFERFEYDRFQGPVPGILGEGIKWNEKKQKYIEDENWDAMSLSSKKNVFDLKVKQIGLNKTISPRSKLAMFEKLFDEIENPYDLTFDEYMSTVAPDFLVIKY